MTSRETSDHEWTLEFATEHSVTVWEDGQPVTTGHGEGRAGALYDAWTTLRGLKRDDLAEGRRTRRTTPA